MATWTSYPGQGAEREQDKMTTHPSAALDRETALVSLQRAARQYATCVAKVAASDGSQELLRAAENRLARMAVAYAEAHGWQPPAPDSMPAA
jgi:hypothetical protein